MTALVSDLEDTYWLRSAHKSCFNHRNIVWSTCRNISIEESLYTSPCSCPHFLNVRQLRVSNFPPCFSWKRYSKAVTLNLFFFLFHFFLMWKPENPFQRRSGSGWNLLTIRLLLIGLFADFPTVVPLSSPSRLSRTMGWKTSYWS